MTSPHLAPAGEPSAELESGGAGRGRENEGFSRDLPPARPRSRHLPGLSPALHLSLRLRGRERHALSKRRGAGSRARLALRVGASGQDEPAGPAHPGGNDLGWESRRPGGRAEEGPPAAAASPEAEREEPPPPLPPRAARADGTVRGAPRADGGASSPRLSSGRASAERRARLLPLQRPREQLEEEEQRRRASPRGGSQHG